MFLEKPILSEKGGSWKGQYWVLERSVSSLCWQIDF